MLTGQSTESKNDRNLLFHKAKLWYRQFSVKVTPHSKYEFRYISLVLLKDCSERKLRKIHLHSTEKYLLFIVIWGLVRYHISLSYWNKLPCLRLSRIGVLKSYHAIQLRSGESSKGLLTIWADVQAGQYWHLLKLGATTRTNEVSRAFLDNVEPYHSLVDDIFLLTSHTTISAAVSPEAGIHPSCKKLLVRFSSNQLPHLSLAWSSSTHLF